MNFILAVEEDGESEEEEEEDVKLLSISGKRSAPGSGSKVPQVVIDDIRVILFWPLVWLLGSALAHEYVCVCVCLFLFLFFKEKSKNCC